MAKIRFAEGAASFARDLCARLLPDDRTVLPVVSIYWWAGVKENHRGPNGESVWETLEPSGWEAHLCAGRLQDDNTILLIAPIVWLPGKKENRRGPNGEAVWERLEPPGWVVDPFGDDEKPKVPAIVPHTILVDGVHVLPLHPKASAAGGTFVISVSKGGIRVKHEEA